MSSVFIGGGCTNLIAASNTAYFVCAAGDESAQDATEANTQIAYRSAGTLKNLYVLVDSNGNGGTTVFRTRVNGANGSMSVSITTGATGEFEDTGATDTISAGDKVNYQYVTGTGGTNIRFRCFSTLFDATSNTVKRFACLSTSIAVNNGTDYLPLAGTRTGSNTTESLAQYKVRTAGTLKNLFVYLSANSRNIADTVRSRVNGGNGNMSVSITALTTGIFEDTSNTDTISSTDLINYAIVYGANGSASTFKIVSAEFETTNGAFHMLGGSNPTGVSVAKNLTRYFRPDGWIDVLTADSQANIKTRYAFKGSYLRVYLDTNGVTAASTLNLRQNAGNSGVSVSITASTTGEFEDTSNSISLADTDEINYQIVTGATGSSLGIAELGFLGSLATQATGNMFFLF